MGQQHFRLACFLLRPSARIVPGTAPRADMHKGHRPGLFEGNLLVTFHRQLWHPVYGLVTEIPCGEAETRLECSRSVDAEWKIKASATKWCIIHHLHTRPQGKRRENGADTTLARGNHSDMTLILHSWESSSTTSVRSVSMLATSRTKWRRALADLGGI